MPTRRTIALAIGLLVVAGGSCAFNPLRVPSIKEFRHLEQQPDRNGPLTVRFAGTMTLLFDDGQTKLLSEGFFSRPGFFRVGFWRIGPDSQRIDAALRKLGVDSIKSVDAVFVGHSHYDHALDAPLIARRAGAMLLGSRSTALLGHAAGVDSDKVKEVHRDSSYTVGNFTLTFLQSEHGPPDRFPGRIHEPFVPPARAERWKNGGVWSVLIRHQDRTMLVHGSANYLEDAFRGYQADVVYLGVGSLGKQSKVAAHELWCEVVRATGAQRVILVHWDDFFRDLGKPLRPMRKVADWLPTTLEWMEEWGTRDDVRVILPLMWEPTNPFDGLMAPAPLSVAQLEERRRACLALNDGMREGE